MTWPPVDRAIRASPHTRGWTPRRTTRFQPPGGFPAHAGMDPRHRACHRDRRGLPRTRGDGPLQPLRPSSLRLASPHTRGWTRLRERIRELEHGFPAHAGMDLRSTAGAARPPRLPRTRGDGPLASCVRAMLFEASPHTRGWTPASRCARSPRGGFPAHAGMDPGRSVRAGSSRRLPRTRGDGPSAGARTSTGTPASPHTRGWTPLQVRAGVLERGFPAHAGMDPAPTSSPRSAAGLPRTRGDGPQARSPAAASSVASPHTRGWT